MIEFKEHNIKKELKKKVFELEKQLHQTQQQLQKAEEQNKVLSSIIASTNPVQKSKIITIKSATKIEFVNVEDIVFCRADMGYTDVQLVDGKLITAAKPLSTFEKVLQEHDFFRISKSHLINPNYIVTFHKDRNELLLQGDVLLPIARRRRIEFLKTL